MRTVQRTYTLFGIAELEDEARQRAYTDWLAKETITRMLPRTATRSKPSATFSALPAPTTVTTVAHTLTVSIPSTRRTRRNFQASACWLTSITTSMRSCTSQGLLDERPQEKAQEPYLRHLRMPLHGRCVGRNHLAAPHGLHALARHTEFQGTHA